MSQHFEFDHDYKLCDKTLTVSHKRALSFVVKETSVATTVSGCHNPSAALLYLNKAGYYNINIEIQKSA